jgi:hypothetical protein
MSAVLPAVHVAPNRRDGERALRLDDPVAFSLPLHVLRGLLLIIGDGAYHAPATLFADPCRDGKHLKLIVSNGKVCLLVRRPLLQPLGRLLIPRLLCQKAQGFARLHDRELQVHLSERIGVRTVTFAGEHRHAFALECGGGEYVDYRRIVPLKPTLQASEYHPRQHLRLWRALHLVLNVPEEEELPVKLRHNGAKAGRIVSDDNTVIATLCAQRQRAPDLQADEQALRNFDLLEDAPAQAVGF